MNELETRYIVIKISDAKKYLQHKKLIELYSTVGIIEQQRIIEERGFLDSLVIESDWPEYNILRKMLISRINSKCNIEKCPGRPSSGVCTHCGRPDTPPLPPNKPRG